MDATVCVYTAHSATHTHTRTHTRASHIYSDTDTLTQWMCHIPASAHAIRAHVSVHIGSALAVGLQCAFGHAPVFLSPLFFYLSQFHPLFFQLSPSLLLSLSLSLTFSHSLSLSL